MEPDRLQYDRAAACVIAQQYSSATFVSLRFDSRRGKFGTIIKYYYISFIYFLQNCVRKLRNLKLPKSCSFCSHLDQTVLPPTFPVSTVNISCTADTFSTALLNRLRTWVPVFLLLDLFILPAPSQLLCMSQVVTTRKPVLFSYLFFWHSVDRVSWYICVITTNRCIFFLIYFNN